jgi:hypothetical protein
VLEFHELEVPWNDVKAGDVCGSDDLGHVPPRIVIANSSEKRLVFADIQLGLMAEKGREACLWIKIDGQHSVAAHRQELGEVSSCGRLSASSFKVHDRDDLQRLVALPVRDVSASALAALVENSAKLIDIVERVRAPAVRLGWWPLPIGRELAQIALVYTNEFCGFCRTKTPNDFLGRWRKAAELMCVKARGQFSRVAADELAKIADWLLEL